MAVHHSITRLPSIISRGFDKIYRKLGLMSCIFINRKCKVACKKENSNMMNQVRACNNMSALTPVFMKRNLQKLMGGGG